MLRQSKGTTGRSVLRQGRGRASPTPLDGPTSSCFTVTLAMPTQIETRSLQPRSTCPCMSLRSLAGLTPVFGR